MGKWLDDNSDWIKITVFMSTMVLICYLFWLPQINNNDQCRNMGFTYSALDVKVEEGYIYCCRDVPNANHIMEKDCMPIIDMGEK